MIYMFLSNNPSSGDINSSNLSFLHHVLITFVANTWFRKGPHFRFTHAVNVAASFNRL